MDLCDAIHNLRAWFFFKDRDVVLQANRVFEGLGIVPLGGIIMWSGAVVDIPTGWSICDGTGGTPDLRDRFVVGAGSTYGVGESGGQSDKNLSHTHTPGTLNTDDDTHRHCGIITYADPQFIYLEGVNCTDYDTHDHDITGGVTGAGLADNMENRPPYYALAFIQRTT